MWNPFVSRCENIFRLTDPAGDVAAHDLNPFIKMELQ